MTQHRRYTDGLKANRCIKSEESLWSRFKPKINVSIRDANVRDPRRVTIAATIAQTPVTVAWTTTADAAIRNALVKSFVRAGAIVSAT